jgi:hypothetical protein
MKYKTKKDMIKGLIEINSVESISLAMLLNEILPDDRTTRALEKWWRE